MPDLVVDANVWAHAQNPAQPLFTASQHLLQELIADGRPLVFDEGLDEDPGKNRSKIFAEYANCIGVETAVARLFAYLLGNGQWRETPRQVPANIWQAIKELVAEDMSDAVYVCVAYNSDDQHLISNDSVVFPEENRERIKKSLGVRVCTALCPLHH